MALTFQDREQLWLRNGGNPLFAPFAAAISMAENAAGSYGANPDTGCEQTGYCAGGCYAVGPWQIECSNIASLISAGVITTANDLADPVKNAAAAIFISGNGQNWAPWSTYWKDAQTRTGPGQGPFTKFLSGSSASAIPTPPAEGSSPQKSSGWSPFASNDPNANWWDKSVFGNVKDGTWGPWAQSALSTTLVIGVGVAFIAIAGLWLAISAAHDAND